MTLLTKVKTSLAIHSRRKVSGLLDGAYASTVIGRSLDFSDLREYVIGDDVKDIDWKATARHGSLLVKRYVTDRKHTVVLAVAAGCEMAAHANPTETKRDVAIMAAGLLGYLATNHGDYVCLELSKGTGVEVVRPSIKEIELERMLTMVQQRCATEQPASDLDSLLNYTIGAIRRRTILVLIINDTAITPKGEALLRRLTAQHEILIVVISDLDPTSVPLSGEVIAINTGHSLPQFIQRDARLARELAELDADRARARGMLLTSLGIPHEQISSTDQVIAAIFRLLERSKRARI